MDHPRLSLVLFLAGALCAPLVAPVGAEVVGVEIERREDVMGGAAFGPAGAYEKLVGRIHFSFDPANPANLSIVDLRFAPQNGRGRVEAYADFMVLQPKDPAKRRKVMWLEVSNRGGKASLRYFNRAVRGALDPSTSDDFGDGLLLREGLTIMWVGWQWDVPDGEGRLRLHVPFARLTRGPIEGLVRADWTVDQDTEVLGLSHRGHRTYPAADPTDPRNQLTVRDGRDAPRAVIPKDRWSFLAPSEGLEIGRLTKIRLEGGFQAGKIYEVVYVAEDPRIVGLGLAAIRDVASYAKYSLDSDFPVERVAAFGVSQTGRFLRHYLYQGFNADERGRRAIDGMLIHTAGAGRGSFNHRFGQPSRDGHRYSAFFYPTDIFPFTSRTQTDPDTGWRDGLMERTPESARPKIMFTNTGYEYWGRAASLIHTSPDGRRDVPPFENERIYHLAGGQHYVAGFPPAEGTRLPGAEAYRGNPLDFLLELRALAVRLVEWVDAGREPPASVYPQIAAGTLVPLGAVAFPSIPGVPLPRVAQLAYRADYGPRFPNQGIIDKQPPELGAPYPVLVPQVDGFGNEMSGVRALELRAPLATYTPWALRTGFPGGTEELMDFTGTFVPLPRDEAERRARSDPRPSIEAIYGNREGYMERARQAAAQLAAEGFLLPGDVTRVLSRAEKMWDWVTGDRGRSGATSGRGS
jgi:Alpha/beta hydrolase domain